jgi:hypothetical protein
MVRLRRSVLSVPGSSDKMISKGLELPADEIMLDLEDGVGEIGFGPTGSMAWTHLSLIEISSML